MAHHGKSPLENNPAMQEIYKKMYGDAAKEVRAHLLAEVGPTGQFPEGKIDKSDDGEIKIAVGVQDGKIVMEFGAPIEWIGFTPEQGQEIGMLLIKRSAQARGKPVSVRISDS